MMRVLVVDDEAPARAKLSCWLGEQVDVQVIGEAADGLDAAARIATEAPDLVFLDIQMPGLTGLEVAAQLDGERVPLLVFVTAHDAFALKAFELDAVDYLLKPYDKERLLDTLARVRKRLGAGARQPDNAVQSARRLQQARGPLKRLLVPAGASLQVIDTATIQWLEADDNYVHVHATARRFTLRRTLQDLLDQLDPGLFVRIHKSSAVNVTAIQALEPLFKGDYEVQLRSGHTLRMSRRFTGPVLALLGSK
jgi:two-component system LytT family response regulator